MNKQEATRLKLIIKEQKAEIKKLSKNQKQHDKGKVSSKHIKGISKGDKSLLSQIKYMKNKKKIINYDYL